VLFTLPLPLEAYSAYYPILVVLPMREFTLEAVTKRDLCREDG
jgi:hypothetical protein